MRKSNPFNQNVNLIVSILFIATVGVYATSTILRKAEMDDPITDSITNSISATVAAANSSE